MSKSRWLTAVRNGGPMTKVEQRQDPEWAVLLIGLMMIAVLQPAAAWAATSNFVLGLTVGAIEILAGWLVPVPTSTRALRLLLIAFGFVTLGLTLYWWIL